MLSNKSYQDILKASKQFFPFLSFNPVDILIMWLIGIKEVSHKKKKLAIKDRLERRIRIFFQNIHFHFIQKKQLKKEFQDAKVVFFLAAETHLKQCLPIAQKLKAKGINNQLILSNKKQIVHTFNKRGFKSYFVSHHFVKLSTKMRKEYEKEVVTFIDHLNRNQDSSTKDLQFLQKKLLREIPPLLQFATLLQDFFGLGQNKKTWIIGNDLVTFGRVATTLAQKNGDLTLSIQHGTIPDDPVHSWHLVDTMMVFGHFGQKRLLEKGIPANKIAMTGAPYMDTLLQQNRSEASQKLIEFLELETNYEKRVLIAVSGAGYRTSEPHHRKMIRAIFSLASKYPDYDFLFKLHPKDRLYYYQQDDLFAQLSNIRIHENLPADISKDIFDWFELAPVIFTGNSAVGAEAILMDKLVFSIDLLNEYQGVDYKDAKAAVSIQSAEELIEQFEKCVIGKKKELYQERMARFVQDYFFKADAKSSNRAAEVVESFIST